MNDQLRLEAQLSLYSDTSCRDTGQYFCTTRPFSMPRSGNRATILQTGKQTFREIHSALMKAEHFVWIADWQMAHDVELERLAGDKDHTTRLHNLIEKIISTKPVHVRVLLYWSVTPSIPGVYDGLVMDRLNALNKRGYPGSVKVLRQKPTTTQNDAVDYSHHQKFVVVDGKIAFIGGIDLTYGRWETPEFDVVIDPSRFVINEMYNPNLRKARPLSQREKDLVEQFKFEEPYGDNLLEEGCQPRMPWQDVHMKLEGPSVVDIHRNFIRRWNVVAKLTGDYMDKKWLQKNRAWGALEAAQGSRMGGAQVQIVRSVSSFHLAAEGKRPTDLELLPAPNEKELWQNCLKRWCDEHQDNILNAMVNCIRSADNYIYIETQFFISQFGRWGNDIDSSKIGNENNGIRNVIVEELADRIGKHIKAKTPFHVYIVIPVHPEGDITTDPVWKQHWLAQTTFMHGTESLVNRIGVYLEAVNRNEKEWTQYVTLLNMRNYGVTVQFARDAKTLNELYDYEIGRYVVTEQIYIHSKLMIVDDAVAIIGSANTNDRSLTGNGDTEIAAIIVDTEDVELRDLGSPTMKVQTRKFARELRKHLWRKHLGLLVNPEAYFNSASRAKNENSIEHPPRLKSTEGQIKKLTGCSVDTILDKPCEPMVVQGIQKLAKFNANVYEKVFTHTPRDNFGLYTAGPEMYTQPYPLLFDRIGTLASKSLVTDPKIGRPRTQKALDEFNARKRANYNALMSHGKDAKYTGIVPPPLQDSYMTKDLLPHQVRGLKEMSFGRRQQVYSDGRVHDIKKAIQDLKEIVGFFVAPPLNWGMKTEVDDPTKATAIGVDIASLHKATNTANT